MPMDKRFGVVRLSWLLTAALAAPAEAASSQARDAKPSEPDSAAVSQVVAQYRAALAAGDSAAALTLLADDALILESGGAETREEYRAHHLPADIQFARAVPSKHGSIRVVVRGDVAWVAGTSTTQGEYRGRAINSVGAELMVLARTPVGWRITAIHWSSRAKSTGK